MTKPAPAACHEKQWNVVVHVALLYNEVTEDPAYDPWLDEEPIFPVVEAINRLGHSVRRVSCTLDLAAVKLQLEQLQPDLVFNRVESLGGSDQMMAAVTMLLDAMQIPYTGCSTTALLTTTGKLSTKKQLFEAGLPTPAWLESPHRGSGNFTRRLSPADDFSTGDGLIMKSVFEHASFKMDDNAVVTFIDVESLEDLLWNRQAKWHRPFFAEKYIEGREFNISILASSDGPLVLPQAEIDFSAFPPDKPRIVGYRAKWESQSFEYRKTPRRFDFPDSDQTLLARLNELTRQCWDLFELSGYARVDFRVDGDGHPWILEINANPSLAPDAGFAAAVARAEMTYEQAIQNILDDARSRVVRPKA